VKGIDKLRMALRVHDVGATVAMELGEQNAFVVT
jgi:hypothetical protein